MPNKLPKELTEWMAGVDKKFVEIKTDQKWFKWIIVGAAGLGFLEKIFGWIAK